MSKAEEIYDLAKGSKVGRLRRAYNWFNSLMVAFLVATLLVGLNLLRAYLVEDYLNFDIEALIFLGLALLVYLINKKGYEYLLAIEVKEERLVNSRNKALAFIKKELR